MKSDGFTLIEISIALIILAFALLALAGLMVTTTKNNSFGGHMTEAATFAQDKLEEFQAMPTDNINSGNDQKTGSQGIQYARNWNVVTGTDDLSKTITKTITLTINWTDRYNHSIRMVSVIRRQLIE
jgi:prepilin-type N-terminal cleavage/methylation domain-containing protein